MPGSHVRAELYTWIAGVFERDVHVAGIYMYIAVNAIYSRTLIFINTWSILHYFYDYITHGDGEFFITKYRLKCVVYYMWRRSFVLW